MLAGRTTERDALIKLLAAARAERGGAVVLRGEVGIGKTALLDELAEAGEGMQLARTTGVEFEMDLPFAGLHQLLLPFLDGIEQLRAPQHGAIDAALGRSSVGPPDLFLVAAAALSLITDAAATRPVLCIVDNAHWLDRPSVDALAFVARRLMADRVAIAFAAIDEEERTAALRGLTELRLGGLSDEALHELLAQSVSQPVDPGVAARIVDGADGNPLALKTLAGELTADELAGISPLRDPLRLSGRLEEVFRAKVKALPNDAQTLLLLAAAEPTGEIVCAAADRLGVAHDPPHIMAVSRFVTYQPTIQFHSSPVRSAVYWGATEAERRQAHQALADACDPVRDEDLRAWHLAAARMAPDEETAALLERSADRARRRGGWSAAAAFLERSAALTPAHPVRVGRLLAAADARLLAGDARAAQALLRRSEPMPDDLARRAQIRRLEGMIQFAFGDPASASRLLIEAAEILRPTDPRAAGEALMEAFNAAHLAGSFANGSGVGVCLRLAGAIAPVGSKSRVAEQLLAGLAALEANGDAVGVPRLRDALAGLLAEDPLGEESSRSLPVGWMVAPELYDDQTWQEITARWARNARNGGSITALAVGLGRYPHFEVLAGRFAVARRAFDEARELATAAGSPTRFAAYTASEITLLAWLGLEDETRAAARDQIRELTGLGRGTGIRVIQLGIAVLELGLGNYGEALRAAVKAHGDDPLLHLNSAPELIEAAVRCGEREVAERALIGLQARAEACGTDWALGVSCRSQALLADDDAAEELYEAAITHLERCLIVPQAGRAHLLYGEWLRRQRRRREAREQLRTAYEMFDALGAGAFAERTRVELQATGEHVRRPTEATHDELTAQEEQIARLASAGATNQEIAGQLFISSATVAYHLKKAFRKLDVANRASLARTLAERDGDVPSRSRERAAR